MSQSVRGTTGSVLGGAVCLGLIALAVVVTWRPVADTFRIASSDGNASYILAVPFLAAALAGVRWARLKAAPRRGHWVGPMLMLTGLAMFWASYPLQMDTLWYASPIVMVIGAIGAVWGRAVLAVAAPALFLLFFMIPMPAIAGQLISVPLQTVASVATVEILNTCGVPVMRAGNLLTINDHNVNVAEACSGMRSTFALLVLIYTFVFLQRFRWGVRIGLLLAAPLLAIVTNLFRLIPVTLAHGYWSEEVAEAMHDWLGYVSFAIAVVLCLSVVTALRWAGVRVLQHRPALQPQATAQVQARKRFAGLPRLAVSSTAVSALVLIGTSFFIYAPARAAQAEAYHDRVKRAFADLPMQLAGWEGETVPLTAPAQELLKPNAVYSVAFTNPTTGKRFSVSMIHCQFAKDMHYHEPRVCYPNSGWQLGPNDQRTWQTSKGEIRGTEYIFRQVRGERLVQLHVANFFVMPDGEIVPLATTVRERMKLPWVDAYGVAQVQLIFNAGFSSDERDAMIKAFVDQTWGAFQVIQSGFSS